MGVPKRRDRRNRMLRIARAELIAERAAEIDRMWLALDQVWADLEANGWRWPAWIGD